VPGVRVLHLRRRVPTGWPPIWPATCTPQRRYRCWPSARPAGRGQRHLDHPGHRHPVDRGRGHVPATAGPRGPGRARHGLLSGRRHAVPAHRDLGVKRACSVPGPAAEITPPYWVFMGTTAISVWPARRSCNRGLTRWAPTCTASSPACRWCCGRPGRGSFRCCSPSGHGPCDAPGAVVLRSGAVQHRLPACMSGVASREPGAALRASWLVTLGRVEAWLALAGGPWSSWRWPVRLPGSRPDCRPPGRPTLGPLADTARAHSGLPVPGQRALASAAATSAGTCRTPASTATHAAIRNPPLSGTAAKASTPTLPSHTAAPCVGGSGRCRQRQAGFGHAGRERAGPPVLAWCGSGSRRGAPWRRATERSCRRGAR
jgi:hypothetical protein